MVGKNNALMKRPTTRVNLMILLGCWSTLSSVVEQYQQLLQVPFAS